MPKSAMMQSSSNPWNFHNLDKALISPNGLHKVVYYDLNEIAMGAPLGGKCFLEIEENQKFKINDWCAGPPVWDVSGRYLAIPMWMKVAFRGTVQKMGVVDLNTMELIIFSKIFKVLYLRSFDGKIIKAINSPVYKPAHVIFNIENEKTDRVVKLVALQ